jgi:hypothetical protein
MRRKTNPHELIEDTFAAMSLVDQEALLRVLAYIHRQAQKDAARPETFAPGDHE